MAGEDTKPREKKLGWFERMRSKAKREWWQGIDYSHFAVLSHEEVFPRAMLSFSEGNLESIHKRNWKGFSSIGKAEFEKLIEETGAPPILVEQFIHRVSGLYGWRHGAAWFELD